jgi:hypothetical protein
MEEARLRRGRALILGKKLILAKKVRFRVAPTGAGGMTMGPEWKLMPVRDLRSIRAMAYRAFVSKE